MLEINSRTLIVDLDGTLIRGDLSWESLLKYVSANPWRLLLVLSWILKGKAYLKHQIASRVNIDAAALHYDEDVLALIRRHKEQGGGCALLTGSHQSYAQEVGDHLQLFAHADGSSLQTNLTGSAKVNHLTERYGAAALAYIGDSVDDVAVWRAVAEPIALYPDPGFADRVAGLRALKARRTGSTWRALLAAARPAHWAKNLLLFVPLLLAHEYADIGLWMRAGVGFVAFSLLASAMYLVNDLLDIEADRKHVTKRKRPLASAELEIPIAIVAALLLTGSALLVAWAVSQELAYWLVTYFALTMLYTVSFKKVAIIDVVALASLYLIRILAGGAATSIEVSFWLLLFGFFIFISIALAKRVGELVDRFTSGRGYVESDAPILSQLGCAFGVASIVVLGLYVNSDDVSALYDHPRLIWFVCPLLAYWLAKLWLDVTRGKLIGGDPVLYTLATPTAYIVAVLGAVILGAAR